MGLLPQLWCAAALWACYRTCALHAHTRMRCATHSGLLPQLVCATHCGLLPQRVVLRTVGCCRSWCVLRTLGVLLPQLVWCCRTLGVLPHALCVLAHTWRSAAAAASLVLALSALSSSPSPTGCWAVRREQERAEDKRSQPSATLRRTWSLAIMVCVVLALTDRARVNRYTDITGIPRSRRQESQGCGAVLRWQQLRFAYAAATYASPTMPFPPASYSSSLCL